MSKTKFDQEAAFKAIVGITEAPKPAPVAANKKKRVNLSVDPFAYAALQHIAYVQRKSVSEIVTQLISDYVDANGELLEEYNHLT